MSRIYQTHHEEQMEAHRRDFMRYWHDTALPILKHSLATEREIGANMHAAWQQWVKDSNFLHKNS